MEKRRQDGQDEVRGGDVRACPKGRLGVDRQKKEEVPSPTPS